MSTKCVHCRRLVMQLEKAWYELKMSRETLGFKDEQFLSVKRERDETLREALELKALADHREKELYRAWRNMDRFKDVCQMIASRNDIAENVESGIYGLAASAIHDEENPQALVDWRNSKEKNEQS